jgi:hypothetical protein
VFCTGAARNRWRAGFADPPYVEDRNFVYYLLKPDATAWWSDVSDSLVDRLVTEHPDIVIDLGNLDWKKADLRFGFEPAAFCSGG